MSMQNLVTLAAMTSGSNPNLQVSPTGKLCCSVLKYFLLHEYSLYPGFR